MNRFRLIILQISLLCVVPSFVAQKNVNELKFAEFPLYEEIYSFLNREIKFPCADCQFSIAKKMDGYYLVLNNWNEEKISDRNFVKIWDASTKNYISPLIGEFLDESDEEAENGLRKVIYADNRFDFMYVYGYPEWINDLKSMLSNKENLTSKEYEMLARATSEQASDFIHPNQYGSNLEETKNLDDPIYEKTTSYRTEQFIELSQKNLFYYYQIKKQTPNYKPFIITDLDLKTAHDQMHCYSYLMSVKEPEAARKFLDLVNYNEGYLTYARDILDACLINSILITHGDTDSYPLWFLQDKHGFRKDVVVLNYSLMQTDWYLTMAKELYNYSTELSKTDFTNFRTEFFIMEEIDENEEVLPFKEWINLAKNRYQETIEKRLNASEEEKTGIYVYLPNSTIISIKGIEIPVNITNYYVPMLDIVTIDLINSNSDRAICTTSPTAFLNTNLYQNCAKHGVVFELSPVELEGYQDNKSADFLIKNIKNINSETINLMGDVGMHKLSSLYNDLENMDESPSIQKELFNQLVEKFPYTLLITNYSTELLVSFSEAAADIDPMMNNKFKEEYASTALLHIEKVNINAQTIKNDVIDLQYIFQVYAEADWQLIAQKTSNFSKNEKQVLIALQKKLKELSGSKRCEDLIWTSEQINKLKIALEEIKL